MTVILRTWADLRTPVRSLYAVGPRNASRLARLGITTLKHLLWHLPARYEDYTAATPIGQIEAGTTVSIQGEVIKISTRRIFPRHLTVTEALIQDSSGIVRAVWFNQPYIENTLIEGSQVSLAGKAQLDKRGLYLASPVYEKITTLPSTADEAYTHTRGLIPIYSETEGITSKYLRFLIKPLLDQLPVADPLPDSITAAYGFPDLASALKAVHYPLERREAERARHRLIFDELLLFQLKALLERRKLNQTRSVPVPFDKEYIRRCIAGLPFELTRDQKVAAWEIFKDLEKSYPMNRLMEGDVGSGKTVVALLAALGVVHSGAQAAFLAPTEVLAQQHYRTILGLVRERGVTVALLTGSASMLDGDELSRPALKKKIRVGTASILIGTHAVIQKDVGFKNLGLVVIDEQHRFGVAQRAALVRSSGASKEQTLIPHLLSMTATPIPRTLALTIFGDLDISIIREKPKNRQSIVTDIVPPSRRSVAYDFVREQVRSGRQVFVICPRIEQAQTADASTVRIPRGATAVQTRLLLADVKAVEQEYAHLKSDVFPDLKVAMLHGKMKPKQKQDIMREFRDGWHDILVSTSVIEVGVDVPNATVMMIESAERFGLAQLHQFRGRVGRAEHQSYCFLMVSNEETGQNKRLQALKSCDDGFELAEEDMKQRGPGEFFGAKQSGLSDLVMASLADVDLIKKARFHARFLLRDDPSLARYPLLRERLSESQSLTHFE